MMVKEIVRLADGKDVLINITHEEHYHLLSFALNELIARGVINLGEQIKTSDIPAPDSKSVN